MKTSIQRFLKKSLLLGSGLLVVNSCSNNEAHFSGSQGKPLTRERPIAADATAKEVSGAMVTTTAPVEAPAKSEVVTPAAPEKTAETQPAQPQATSILPTDPPVVTPPAPQPAAQSADPAPSCQLVASSYRVHQDSSVGISLFAVNAASASIEQSAVALDSQQKASVFFNNIAADREFTAQVKTNDGQVATCKAVVLVTGKWHKSQNKACSIVCSAVNADNVQDPLGSKCASGENNANTLFNKFQNYYPYGTWGSGRPTLNTANIGSYCYAQPSTMQTRDNDPTDRTTGCYCWDRR